MKRLAKIIGLSALSFLVAGLVHADNCGSLSDCFYTIGSATAAAVGVAVMVIVGLLLDLFGWGGGEVASEPVPAPPVYSANDPAADAIVKDPKVKAAIEKAFAESLDNTVPEADVREQGGWIVRLPNGELDVVRWPEGANGSITPSKKPENAVADFHTHPYGNDVGMVHGPSTQDSMATKAEGIPGFVIDRTSIMRVDPDNPGTFRDVILK